MILYLSAKTKIPDLSIDFIEVILENGREVSLNWDETDIKRENGEITARYKGVYFGEEYANGKIAELEDFSISYIGIYSETEGPFDISIDEMVLRMVIYNLLVRMYISHQILCLQMSIGKNLNCLPIDG